MAFAHVISFHMLHIYADSERGHFNASFYMIRAFIANFKWFHVKSANGEKWTVYSSFDVLLFLER